MAKKTVHQSCMVETSRGGAPFKSKRALPRVDIIVAPAPLSTTAARWFHAVQFGPSISKRAIGDKTTMAHTAYTCSV